MRSNQSSVVVDCGDLIYGRPTVCRESYSRWVRSREQTLPGSQTGSRHTGGKHGVMSTGERVESEGNLSD